MPVRRGPPAEGDGAGMSEHDTTRGDDEAWPPAPPPAPDLPPPPAAPATPPPYLPPPPAAPPSAPPPPPGAPAGGEDHRAPAPSDAAPPDPGDPGEAQRPGAEPAWPVAEEWSVDGWSDDDEAPAVGPDVVIALEPRPSATPPPPPDTDQGGSPPARGWDIAPRPGVEWVPIDDAAPEPPDAGLGGPGPSAAPPVPTAAPEGRSWFPEPPPSWDAPPPPPPGAQSTFAPPPPAAHPYRHHKPVSPVLAAFLQGLVGLAALVNLGIGVAAFFTQTAFDNYVAPSGGASQLRAWDDADSLLAIVSLLELPVMLALFVLLVLWAWFTHAAVDGLAQRRWGRGWTIGAWFVPIANIVLPKLVLDETDRIASAAVSRNPAVNWRTVHTSTVGTFWWWLFVVSNLVMARATFANGSIQVDPDIGDYRAYYWSIGVGSLIAMVSALCGLFYVQEISHRLGPQSPLFAPLPEHAPVPAAANKRELVSEMSAGRMAGADVFCELCREPMRASATRCPRCGKPRKAATRSKGATVDSDGGGTGNEPAPAPPPEPPAGRW